MPCTVSNFSEFLCELHELETGILFLIIIIKIYSKMTETQIYNCSEVTYFELQQRGTLVEKLADLLHSFFSQRCHDDTELDHLIGTTQISFRGRYTVDQY